MKDEAWTKYYHNLVPDQDHTKTKTKIKINIKINTKKLKLTQKRPD